MDINFFKKAKMQAMKDKNRDAMNAYDAIISKIMLQTIEARSKGKELTEGDIIVILQKVEKELQEERLGYEKGGRTESVASLDVQIATVTQYLPKMMSDEEIKAEIEKLDDKSIGSVMKYFKTNFNGKCDMKKVGEILKSL
ncbi:MAG: GatB/YqeY domain-containing protein [Christensenellales bacterium]